MLATPALAPAVRSLPRRRARASPPPAPAPRPARSPARLRAVPADDERAPAAAPDDAPSAVASAMASPLPPSSSSSPPGTPRATWRVTTSGALSGLERHEDVLPPPGPGEIRVDVRAIGLNFADVFSVLGLYQAAPPCPFVPGLELSGVVAEIGPPARDLPPGAVVPEYAVGDDVMCVTRFGAYATRVNAPAHQTRPLPPGWSHAEGAGFLVQGLTAFYALSALGGVRRGHKVVVHSAAGGCGSFGLGICAALGADAIATLGNAGKAAVVRERHPELDPEQIIVRDRRRFQAQVEAAAVHIAKRRGEVDAPGAEPDRVDVVMDAVMGDFFKGGWNALARGGRYVVFGAADLTPAGDLRWYNVWGWIKLGWKYARRDFVDPTSLPGENKSVMGFNLIWMFDKVAELGELLGDLGGLGLPAPAVGARFTFDELPDALRKFQTGQTTGKVVVVVEEE